jgi:hypothetical protein
VEINRASVAAVREFADYNGHIYDHPKVRVVIDEGRSYLRRSDQSFDLIYLSKVNTDVAEMAQYALAENYIYTLESFGDYLDHLSEDGIVAIQLHEERDLLRAFLTALAALTERVGSPQDAMKHIVMFNQPENPGVDEPIELPLIILKRSPFTQEEAKETFVAALTQEFVPLYMPYLRTGVPAAMELASGRITLDGFIAREETLDLRPPSDDQPFFYEFYRGLPGQLKGLLYFLSAVVLVGAVYFWLYSRGAGSGLGRFGLYFAGLGVGFMLIEISIIQRLTLFLGHPTLAFVTVIFSLLLSGAVGSLVTGRLGHKKAVKVATLFAWAVGLVSLIYIPMIPLVVDALLAQDILIRSLVAGVLIAPLGFLMGAPFPLGLRWAKRAFNSQQVSLMWGVNGVMSVVGSVTAVVIATQRGYTWCMLAGALIYFGVALLATSGLARVEENLVSLHP